MAGKQDISNNALWRRVTLEGVIALLSLVWLGGVAYSAIDDNKGDIGTVKEDVRLLAGEVTRQSAENQEQVLKIEDDIAEIKVGQSELRTSIRHIIKNQDRILKHLTALAEQN